MTRRNRCVGLTLTHEFSQPAGLHASRDSRNAPAPSTVAHPGCRITPPRGAMLCWPTGATHPSPLSLIPAKSTCCRYSLPPELEERLPAPASSRMSPWAPPSAPTASTDRLQPRVQRQPYSRIPSAPPPRISHVALTRNRTSSTRLASRQRPCPAIDQGAAPKRQSHGGHQCHRRGIDAVEES